MIDLLTSFENRISRKQFWLGLLLAGLLIIVAGGAAISLFSGVALKAVQGLVGLAAIYIWAAVLVKRLHDRGKPAMPWVAIFMAPGIALQIVGLLEIGYRTMEIAGTQFLVPGMLTTVLTYASVAVSLWMLVELGFRQGQSGDNAYGPDPLSRQGAAAPA